MKCSISGGRDRVHPQLRYIPEKCMFCGACMAACPNGCHSFQNGEHRISRESCILCGECADICPERALILCGKNPE